MKNKPQHAVPGFCGHNKNVFEQFKRGHKCNIEVWFPPKNYFNIILKAIIILKNNKRLGLSYP